MGGGGLRLTETVLPFFAPGAEAPSVFPPVARADVSCQLRDRRLWTSCPMTSWRTRSRTTTTPTSPPPPSRNKNGHAPSLETLGWLQEGTLVSFSRLKRPFPLARVKTPAVGIPTSVAFTGPCRASLSRNGLHLIPKSQ